MSPGSQPIGGLSSLDQARIDIEVLKLMVKVLLASVAVQAGKSEEEMHDYLRLIKSFTEKGIAEANFRDPDRAEIWRDGMRASVNNIIDPLLV